jgi:cell volume regulation protein A
MIESLTAAILIASGLVVVSIFTSLIAFRIGAPLLLFFLGVGLMAGESGLLGIGPGDAPAAYLVGSAALAIILFDSGFDTSFASYRTAAWPALTLATLGVGLTTAMVAVPGHVLLGLDWVQGLLLGAIVSSTDAAAVFFLLRVGGITLRDRVRSTLEIESGTNDPMAIFLTITLVELIAQGHTGSDMGWLLLLGFVEQMGIGAVAGVLAGQAIVHTVNRLDLERALYPLLVLSMALVTFAGTNLLGGSGFLAVYIAGLVAGNAQLRGIGLIRRIQGGMTWMAQITMFLTLGMLATPSHLVTFAVPALAVAGILIFVARPLAVWLCLAPFGFNRAETAFVAWVGLRGAVSILLAILPLIRGLPGAPTYFNTAFVVVLVSLIIQGWTLGRTARGLGLVVPRRIGPVERVELELPGNARHELVVYRIVKDSPVARGQRLPRWARPSLVVRGGLSYSVHRAGRLQPGDTVYVFIPPRMVPLLDRLFASPALLDHEDSQFWGDFALSPDARLGELSLMYDVPIGRHDPAWTVGELLRREFGGRVETGDRLALGPVDLIVRDVDEDHRVTAVGLALEPEPRRGARAIECIDGRGADGAGSWRSTLAGRLKRFWR